VELVSEEAAMTNPTVPPRMLRVLTLDQRSDYHRILYDELVGRVDETGLDNEVNWAELDSRLDGIDFFHLHWPEWLLGQDLVAHSRLAAALRQAGVSVVWSQHNLTAHQSPSGWRPIYQFWARQVDGVIHHSKWGMAVALASLPYRPGAAHVVMPHPHFGQLRMVDSSSRPEIEGRLGWRHDVLRLTIIGAPRRGKLVPEVAAAVSRSARRDVELRIFSLRPGETIVTDPRVAAEPYTRADRLLWDQRLAASDALIMPFHQTPTPMLTTGTIAEAVTHGLPCLTSDWPYLTETLGDAAIVYGSSPLLLTDVVNRLEATTLARARNAATRLQAMYSPQSAATILHDLLLTVRSQAEPGTGRPPSDAALTNTRENRP
jgi:glycosyltransferase involved in cell wall biosynthesis